MKLHIITGATASSLEENVNEWFHVFDKENDKVIEPARKKIYQIDYGNDPNGMMLCYILTN